MLVFIHALGILIENRISAAARPSSMLLAPPPIANNIAFLANCFFVSFFAFFLPAFFLPGFFLAAFFFKLANWSSTKPSLEKPAGHMVECCASGGLVLHVLVLGGLLDCALLGLLVVSGGRLASLWAPASFLLLVLRINFAGQCINGVILFCDGFLQGLDGILASIFKLGSTCIFVNVLFDQTQDGDNASGFLRCLSSMDVLPLHTCNFRASTSFCASSLHMAFAPWPAGKFTPCDLSLLHVFLGLFEIFLPHWKHL